MTLVRGISDRRKLPFLYKICLYLHARVRNKGVVQSSSMPSIIKKKGRTILSDEFNFMFG